jgi:hypothetical protein
MAKKSWLKIIGKLKKLISDVGPLWPDSTKLSGFSGKGPFHCADCEYLKGLKSGKVFLDEKGQGRCNHPVVIADPEVKKDSKLIPIIPDIQKYCCEFVEPLEKEEQESKES